jgi:hypothetical protein
MGKALHFPTMSPNPSPSLVHLQFADRVPPLGLRRHRLLGARLAAHVAGRGDERVPALPGPNVDGIKQRGHGRGASGHGAPPGPSSALAAASISSFRLLLMFKWSWELDMKQEESRLLGGVDEVEEPSCWANGGRDG